MPTNEQRRETAKRKLERQLERREQKARKQRLAAIIGSVLAALVAVAVVVGLVWLKKDKDDKSDEIEELRGKIEKAGMPKETEERALAELKRLEAMPNVSAEATVSRNYIDWLVTVPWKKATREANSALYAFPASRAPVSESIDVTT